MTGDVPSSNLRRYFAGITESTFQVHLGVADPSLVDYVSDLLVRFIRTDAMQRARTTTGRRINRIGEMFVEAEQRVGEARRGLHCHIGDVALFWAGMYPEALRQRGTVDCYEDYCIQGKRAYHIASTIESEAAPPSEILERLSSEFEMCCYGLREVRREIERRDDEDPQHPYLIN